MSGSCCSGGGYSQPRVRQRELVLRGTHRGHGDRNTADAEAMLQKNFLPIRAPDAPTICENAG